MFKAMLRWLAAKSGALVTGSCAVSSVCMPELSGRHDAVAAIVCPCFACRSGGAVAVRATLMGVGFRSCLVASTRSVMTGRAAPAHR